MSDVEHAEGEESQAEAKPPALIYRPVSHRWAIALFSLRIAGEAVLAFMGKAQLWMICEFVLCVIALEAALARPRQRRSYWLGTAALLSICLSGFYYFYLEPALHPVPIDPIGAATHPGGTATGAAVFQQTVVMTLVFCVSYCYIFGRASREYFGFGKKTS